LDPVLENIINQSLAATYKMLKNLLIRGTPSPKSFNKILYCKLCRIMQYEAFYGMFMGHLSH